MPVVSSQHPLFAKSLRLHTTRHGVLDLLTGVPLALLGLTFTDDSPPVAEEILPFCTASITACWHLSKGKDTIPAVTHLLESYLPPLVTLVKEPSKHQRTAAAVASQGYLLGAILASHRNDFVTRESYCKQALQYAQLAEDDNLQGAAMKTLAATFYYNKRFGKAFQTYQSVLPLASRTSPLIRTHIYACSAEAYARFGYEQDALTYIGLARDTFPDRPEDDPHFLYAECSYHTLSLWEGLVRLNLGQPGEALQAFERVDGLQPKVKVSERIRIEFLNHQARAATVARNMEQACTYLETAVMAALALGSERRYSEAQDVYDQMLLIWPFEPRVKRLAQLFQQ